MNEIFKSYEEQGISKGLLKDIESFRTKYPVEGKIQERILKPEIAFYGKEIFEMAAAA